VHPLHVLARKYVHVEGIDCLIVRIVEFLLVSRQISGPFARGGVGKR
jgi:hypothetical protein